MSLSLSKSPTRRREGRDTLQVGYSTKTSRMPPKRKGKRLRWLGQSRLGRSPGSACGGAGAHLGVVFALWERGELQLHVLHGPRAPAGGRGARDSGAPGRPPGWRRRRGKAGEGRRADARRAHSEHSRTTVSGRLQQEGKGQGDALPAAMLRPTPSAGLRAPQTAGIRPRHEPITVSSRPHPRATANPSPRSPTARPRRRQVSACLRPARPRARRRGGRGLLRGGAGPRSE